MSDTPEKERRKGTRVGAVYKVSVEVGDKTLHGKSRDISEGGVFVRMPSGLSANMEVALTVESDLNAEPIRLLGRVVHALPGIGSGIEFVAPTREAVNRIAALIRKLKERPDSN